MVWPRLVLDLNSWWNPFRPLPTIEAARAAARAGTFVAAWLGAPVALVMVFLAEGFAGGRMYLSPASSMALPFVPFVTLLAFIVFVGWRLWVSQPRWAAACVFLLTCLQLLATAGLAMTTPVSAWPFVSLLPLLAWAYAILCLRGAFALPRLRRADERARLEAFS